jgi:hypothetical protein
VTERPAGVQNVQSPEMSITSWNSGAKRPLSPVFLAGPGRRKIPQWLGGSGSFNGSELRVCCRRLLWLTESAGRRNQRFQLPFSCLFLLASRLCFLGKDDGGAREK